MPHDGGRARRARPESDSPATTLIITTTSGAASLPPSTRRKPPPPPPPPPPVQNPAQIQQNRYNLDSCGSSDSGQGTLESSSSSHHAKLYNQLGAGSFQWPVLVQRQCWPPAALDQSFVCGSKPSRVDDSACSKTLGHMGNLQLVSGAVGSSPCGTATTSNTMTNSDDDEDDDDDDDEEEEEEDDEDDDEGPEDEEDDDDDDENRHHQRRRRPFDCDIVSKLTQHHQRRRKSSSVFTSSCSNSSAASVAPLSSSPATTAGSSSSSSCCSSAAGLSSRQGSMSSFGASELRQQQSLGLGTARSSRSPSESSQPSVSVRLRERRRSSWLKRNGTELGGGGGGGERWNCMSASLECDEDELDGNELSSADRHRRDEADDEPTRVGSHEGASPDENLRRAIGIGARDHNGPRLAGPKRRAEPKPDDDKTSQSGDQAAETPSCPGDESRLAAPGELPPVAVSLAAGCTDGNISSSSPAAVASPFCYCSQAGSEQNAQTKNSKQPRQEREREQQTNTTQVGDSGGDESVPSPSQRVGFEQELGAASGAAHDKSGCSIGSRTSERQVRPRQPASHADGSESAPVAPAGRPATERLERQQRQSSPRAGRRHMRKCRVAEWNRSELILRARYNSAPGQSEADSGRADAASIEGSLRMAEFYPLEAGRLGGREPTDGPSGRRVVAGQLLVCLDLDEAESKRALASGLIGVTHDNDGCHSSRHASGPADGRELGAGSPGGGDSGGAGRLKWRARRALLMVGSAPGRRRPSDTEANQLDWLLASSQSGEPSSESGSASSSSTPPTSIISSNDHRVAFPRDEREEDSSSPSSSSSSCSSDLDRAADESPRRRLSAATRRACFWRLVASATDSSQPASGDESEVPAARRSLGSPTVTAAAVSRLGGPAARANDGHGERARANPPAGCPLVDLFREATSSNPNNRPKLVLMAGGQPSGTILTGQLSGSAALRERGGCSGSGEQQLAAELDGGGINSNNSSSGANVQNNESLARLNSIHEQQEEPVAIAHLGRDAAQAATCSASGADPVHDNEPTITGQSGFKASAGPIRGCRDNESAKGSDGSSDNNDEDDVEAEVELGGASGRGANVEEEDDDYFYDEELSMFNQSSNGSSQQPQQQQHRRHMSAGLIQQVGPSLRGSLAETGSAHNCANPINLASQRASPQPIASATERFLSHLSRAASQQAARPLLVWAPTARRVSCPVGQVTSYSSWRQLWPALPPEPHVAVSAPLCFNCLNLGHLQQQQQQQQQPQQPQAATSPMAWDSSRVSTLNKTSHHAEHQNFASFDQSEPLSASDLQHVLSSEQQQLPVGIKRHSGSFRGDSQSSSLRRRALGGTNSIGAAGAGHSTLLRANQHRANQSGRQQRLGQQQPVELPPLELRRQSTITGFDHYRHTAPRSPSLCLPPASLGSNPLGRLQPQQQRVDASCPSSSTLTMPSAGCAASCSGRLLLSPTHSTGGSSSPSPTSWHQNALTLIGSVPPVSICNGGGANGGNLQQVRSAGVQVAQLGGSSQRGNQQFGRARLESLESDRGSSPSWTNSTSSLRSSIGGGSSIYSALNLAHVMASGSQQQQLIMGQARKRSSGSVCSTASSSGVSSIVPSGVAGLCAACSSGAGGNSATKTGACCVAGCRGRYHLMSMRSGVGAPILETSQTGQLKANACELFPPPQQRQEQAVYFFLCCCQGSKSSRDEEQAEQQQQQQPQLSRSSLVPEGPERRVPLIARAPIVGADSPARSGSGSGSGGGGGGATLPARSQQQVSETQPGREGPLESDATHQDRNKTPEDFERPANESSKAAEGDLGAHLSALLDQLERVLAVGRQLDSGERQLMAELERKLIGASARWQKPEPAASSSGGQAEAVASERPGASGPVHSSQPASRASLMRYSTPNLLLSSNFELLLRQQDRQRAKREEREQDEIADGPPEATAAWFLSRSPVSLGSAASSQPAGRRRGSRGSIRSRALDSSSGALLVPASSQPAAIGRGASLAATADRKRASEPFASEAEDDGDESDESDAQTSADPSRSRSLVHLAGRLGGSEARQQARAQAAPRPAASSQEHLTTTSAPNIAPPNPIRSMAPAAGAQSPAGDQVATATTTSSDSPHAASARQQAAEPGAGSTVHDKSMAQARYLYSTLTSNAGALLVAVQSVAASSLTSSTQATGGGGQQQNTGSASGHESVAAAAAARESVKQRAGEADGRLSAATCNKSSAAAASSPTRVAAGPQRKQAQFVLDQRERQHQILLKQRALAAGPTAPSSATAVAAAEPGASGLPASSDSGVRASARGGIGSSSAAARKPKRRRRHTQSRTRFAQGRGSGDSSPSSSSSGVASPEHDDSKHHLRAGAGGGRHSDNSDDEAEEKRDQVSDTPAIIESVCEQRRRSSQTSRSVSLDVGQPGGQAGAGTLPQVAQQLQPMSMDPEMHALWAQGADLDTGNGNFIMATRRRRSVHAIHQVQLHQQHGRIVASSSGLAQLGQQQQQQQQLSGSSAGVARRSGAAGLSQPAVEPNSFKDKLRKLRSSSSIERGDNQRRRQQLASDASAHRARFTSDPVSGGLRGEFLGSQTSYDDDEDDDEPLVGRHRDSRSGSPVRLRAESSRDELDKADGASITHAATTGDESQATDGGDGLMNERAFELDDGTHYDLAELESNTSLLADLFRWNYPIFDLAHQYGQSILSKLSYRIFFDSGFFESFKIPKQAFFNFFHALEEGYLDKPYHNRLHAADVLHAVYYLTSQPIGNFCQVPLDLIELYDNLLATTKPSLSSGPAEQRQPAEEEEEQEQDPEEFVSKLHNHIVAIVVAAAAAAADSELPFGIMGANLTALEVMALYTAAAMHDFQHPGRTNSFLVATSSPLALLYNDRSVLENHHSAAAWALFYSAGTNFNWLCNLEKDEFKRFRFMIIELILATDLMRHYELVSAFNKKLNNVGRHNIDWFCESDRLLVMEIIIKLADVNGPMKGHRLHCQWTDRIAMEFYEQGDEERALNLPVSLYMDRSDPRLPELQKSFINHLVGPLSHSYAAAGFFPESSELDSEPAASGATSVEPDASTKTSAGSLSAQHNAPGEGHQESVYHQSKYWLIDDSLDGRKKLNKQFLECTQTMNLRNNFLYWDAKSREKQQQQQQQQQ